MITEIRRNTGKAEDFTLLINPLAGKDLAWNAEQDKILNDAAFNVARQTIGCWPGYAVTPLIPLNGLAAQTGVAAIHYKDEAARFNLRSFKALGGAYAVARLLQSKASAALGRPVDMSEIVERKHPELVASITVCCATDGNHGRSVAWGAQTFGCKCEIFIHATVSDGRKTAIEAFGAQVRRCAGNYDDSVREAQDTASREGWFVVSDTSYPGYLEVPKDVMQGYELMAAEAFDQLDTPPTHIFVQTGVGGMAAAVAAQAKRRWGSARPTLILADPDKSACWLDSLRAGHPTAVEGDLDTLMAGLACGEVSMLAWGILTDHADAVMALTDQSAVDCMRRLAQPVKGDPPIVAGESAVAGLAGFFAAMSDQQAAEALGLTADARVLIFGTEGDTDPALYKELVGKTADAVRQAA